MSTSDLSTSTIDFCASLVETAAARGSDTGKYRAYNSKYLIDIPLAGYIQCWCKNCLATDTDDDTDPDSPISSPLSPVPLRAQRCDVVVVHAMILIDRLCTQPDFSLTARNVHRVVLGALLLATKWHAWRPFTMSHYALVGGVGLAELQRLERLFLTDIEWRVDVSTTTFAFYMAKMSDVAELMKGDGKVGPQQAAAVKIGDTVELIEALVCTDLTKATEPTTSLPEGLRGKVTRVNSDGGAIVVFAGKKTWMAKESFCNHKIRRIDSDEFEQGNAVKTVTRKRADLIWWKRAMVSVHSQLGRVRNNSGKPLEAVKLVSSPRIPLDDIGSRQNNAQIRG